MSDQRQNEPLNPELQREDARGPDGAERQPEREDVRRDDSRADALGNTEERVAAGRDDAWHEEHEVGPLGESRHGDVSHEPAPEGVERFNRVEEAPRSPDQPIASDAPDKSVRQPGMGPSENIEFDENENVPPRETQQGATGPALASGMFLPVIILMIVAIIAILWIVL